MIALVPLADGSVVAAMQSLSGVVPMGTRTGASVLDVGSRNAYAQSHAPGSDRLGLYSAMLADDYSLIEKDVASEVVGMARSIEPRPTVPAVAYERLGEARQYLREGRCRATYRSLSAVREAAAWWGQLYKIRRLGVFQPLS